MQLPIKHKRGTTVPTAGDLVVGEIAINTTTGVCYTKTGAGNVIAIGQDIAAIWGSISGDIADQTDLQDALDAKYDASNPNGYIPEANVDGNLYGRKNGQWELVPATDLTGYATETYVTSQGYITSAALSGYATETYVTTRGYLVNGDNGTVPAGGDAGQVLTKASNSNYSFIWSTPIVYDRYLTTSTTSLTVSTGVKTLTVGTGLSYTSQQDIIIAHNATSHMHATVTTYDSVTGELVCDVQNKTGSGTFTDWTINVGGTVPLTSTSWGAITGTLSNQTDLQSALDGKYSTSNPSGYITSSALTPYALKSGTTFTGTVYVDDTGDYPFRVTNASNRNYGTMLDNGVIRVGNDPAVGGSSSPRAFLTPEEVSLKGTGFQEAGLYLNNNLPGANPPQLRLTETDGILSSNVTLVKQGKIYYNGVESYLSSANLALYAPLAGATFTGKVVAKVSATSGAGLNLGNGVAPTSPVAGDVWLTTNTLYFQDNASTTRQVANVNSTNTFSSPQIIDTTSATLPALRVTQKGTGPTLLVEDDTNPDTTSFVISSAGKVGIGVPVGWTPGVYKVEISDTGGLYVGGVINCNGGISVINTKITTNTSNADAPSLNLGTAGNSSPTGAVNGDVWITNAASPKFAYRTGGVNYYCVVANAFNTFTGGVAITGSSASNPQLAISQSGSAQALKVDASGTGTGVLITQTGTGNALIVEDSTNPDASSLVVDASGNVGIGVAAGFTPSGKLDVVGAITCTTPTVTDESTKVATTAHVKSVVRGHVEVVVGPASYTINGTYANTVIKRGNHDSTGSPTALIVPTNATVPIPIGTQFVIIQSENDPFTITPDPGVGVGSRGNKMTSAGWSAVCSLIKTDTDEWYLAGDLV